MTGITETPRWLRITYRDPDGKRRTFTGMVRLEAGRIRGERRDDVKDGIALNLLIGSPADVLKVD